MLYATLFGVVLTTLSMHWENEEFVLNTIANCIGIVKASLVYEQAPDFRGSAHVYT